MNIEFDYKICELKNYLTEEEMISLDEKIMSFDVDLSEIKTTLGFLCWSENVQSKVKEIDYIRYNEIISKQYITFNDFQFLSELNKEYDFNDDDYFNFFLTYSNESFRKVGIYDYIKKAHNNIIFDLFGKQIKSEYQESMIGHINIYPKNSFIKKHQDNDPDGQRLFTILFFLNGDRTEEQGSLLRLFKQDDIVNVVPNYKNCIIIEHQKHNLTHDVTLNLVDDVRYSIYCPFTIKDYQEKLQHN